MNELRCTSVRIGSRLVLVPDGQPIVADVVYGPAPAEIVYRTFYEATHCPNGHLRASYARERPDRGRIVHPCARCEQEREGVPRRTEWTWGAPA